MYTIGEPIMFEDDEFRNEIPLVKNGDSDKIAINSDKRLKQQRNCNLSVYCRKRFDIKFTCLSTS